MRKARAVLIILGTLMVVYMLLRITFYFLHFSDDASLASDLLPVVYWGMRLDFTAVFLINVPFLLYYFLLHDRLPVRGGWLGPIVLLLLNVPFLAINFIDLVYYRFTHRRSNTDLWYVWLDSVPAVASTLTMYIIYAAAFIVTISLLAFVFAKTLKWARSAGRVSWRKNLVSLGCIFAAGAILARGWDNRPILPSTPLLYFPPSYQSLVSNSSLSLLYSAFRPGQIAVSAGSVSEDLPDSIFTISRKYNARPPGRKNLVVFIMESMSGEYLDPADARKARTPFLDSLMKTSIVCRNAFANGSQSNEGIVAVLGSIPPFFDIPYYHSIYANNRVKGIGTLLGEEGYMTSFFHGSEFDHFGFAKMTGIAGIRDYYSAETYGNKDHNGSWGVHDDKFFGYAADVLSRGQQPFFAVLYNVSTHDPYSIPLTMQSRFQIAGQSAAQNSISYLDEVYRAFFERLAREEWYDNTIFLFCADHWLAGSRAGAVNGISAFRIPFIVHIPGRQQAQVIDRPVQQLDVVPTLLDLTGYPKMFMSFGASIFDSSARYAYNRYMGYFQVTDSAYVLGYDPEEGRAAYLYNYREDPEHQVNLVGDSALQGRRSELQRRIGAFLGVFKRSVEEDKLYIVPDPAAGGRKKP